MLDTLSARELVAAVIIAGIAACGGTQTPPAAERPLTLVSFSPEAGTVSAEEPLRLAFDRPVVPEELVGVVLDEPPVRLEPAVKVTGVWSDRQTLLVRPTGELAPSTRYRVGLAPELARRLRDEPALSFVNRPLREAVRFGFDPDLLPVDPRIGLRFDQDVSARDIEDRCLFKVPRTGEVIDVVTPDPDLVGAEMVLSPAVPLDRDEDYTLECVELAGHGGDAPMESPLTLELRTHPDLHVVSFGPTGRDVWSDEVPIEIEFSTPIDEERLRRALSAQPKIEGLERGSLDQRGRRFRVVVDLKSDTGYAIRLDEGFTDTLGQRLEGGLTFEFTTGSARPRFSMETGIFAVEAATGEGYPVWTRNVSRFDVECARVPEKGLVALLTGEMNYDPWYDAGSSEDIDWKKLGLARKQRKVRVNQPKDQWHLERIGLGETCGGKGARGLFLAEVRSDEVQPDPDQYWRFKPRQRVLANVTDLGVLLKAGSAAGLAWVTRLSDGAPVAGAKVTVYDTRGRAAHTGSTDADGIARLPGSDALLRQGGAGDKGDVEGEGEEGEEYDTWRGRRFIVVVEQGGDLAVVDGNWSNGIQIWNFGVPADYRGGATRHRGFILSDRGIYRPGERVHFKGLVRELAPGRLPAVPSEKRVAIRIEDARGLSVFDRRVPLSEFGGFHFDLALGSAASLGDWHVTARIGGQVFRESFIVEEFRKVTYEVDIDAGERHTRLGRKLRFDVRAGYLFGAPVAGAGVGWSVMRRAHALHFPGYQEYAFTDLAADGYGWWWWDRDDGSCLDFVEDGNGETDGRGRFAFAVSDGAQDLTGPQDYLVQVTLEDPTGESVSRRTVVTAHRSELYVGLHAQEWVQAVGMPFAVNTVAVRPDGTRLAAKATLKLVRQRQDCRYSAGPRAVPRCETGHEEIWSRPVEIPATGNGTERIVPAEPGEYVIRLEAEDARGNQVVASSPVWVLGRGEAFWSGDESARMALVASRSEYRPGETAKLAPRSSIGAGLALVTLERDGVIEARVERLASAGQGIEIELGAEHAPNVYASVALVKGRTGEGDRHRPRFQMGVADLKVSSADRRLKVELLPERVKYEPGEKIRGKVRVTSGGGPVRAEVALSVADEGVLQLIGYKTPDPLKAFYAPFSLGVDTATNWNRISRLNDPRVLDPDEGGDSGGGGTNPQVRSRFVSSAFWAPALVTDDKGEAAFEFAAPDNLTAFRMMAVAADAGIRFGSGEGRLTVSKPLLARPLLPRFVAGGDRVEVGVDVRNLTGAAGEVQVKARARGAVLDGSSRKVKLEDGASAVVRFPATIPLAGEVSFTFDVSMGGHRDAVRVTLPVELPLTRETRVLARGRTEGKGPVAVDLKWPAAALPAHSSLEITVDRAGLAELGPGLRHLVRYPYGCLEQTLSRLIPLIQVEALARSLDLEELRGARLERFIKTGVEKVTRHQQPDGHFSLWPGGTAYPHLTVFAIYGLLTARRAGIVVDETVIDGGVAALRRYVADPVLVAGGGGEAGTVAMAAYVLAEAGKPDHGLMARLHESRRGLPTYGQGFLLLAMAAADADAGLRAELERELLGRVERTGERAAVREQGDFRAWMGSDVRSTAIVLSALIGNGSEDRAVHRLAEGLRESQRPGGGWHSTQDNLYSLVALGDYARREAGGELEVSVRAGDELLASRTLTGHQVFTFGQGLDRLEPGRLELVTSGPARYAVRLRLGVRDDRGESRERGFTVTREYLDPGKDEPKTAFAVGDLVRVRVTVKADGDRYWVAVEDPLPAGFEAVNTRLETSQVRPARDDGRDERYRYGYRRNEWSYTELRDDRVLAFADRFHPGEAVLEYLARALTPGSFTAAPARAEQMYEPEVFGRTAAAKVEVSR
jgi:hypothetical protein